MTLRDAIIVLAVLAAHLVLLRISGPRPPIPFARAPWVEVTPAPSSPPSPTKTVPSRNVEATAAALPVTSAAPSTVATRVEILADTLRQWGNAPPEYPEEARNREREGVVVLDIDSGPRGEAARIVLTQSSGEPSLDEAARKAAQGWRFPETRAYRVRVEFHLQ